MVTKKNTIKKEIKNNFSLLTIEYHYIYLLWRMWCTYMEVCVIQPIVLLYRDGIYIEKWCPGATQSRNTFIFYTRVTILHRYKVYAQAPSMKRKMQKPQGHWIHVIHITNIYMYMCAMFSPPYSFYPIHLDYFSFAISFSNLLSDTIVHWTIFIWIYYTIVS